MAEEVKETKEAPVVEKTTTSTTSTTSSGGSNSTLKIILIIIGVLILLGLAGCVAVGFVAKKAVDSGVKTIQEQADQIQSDLGSIDTSIDTSITE